MTSTSIRITVARAFISFGQEDSSVLARTAVRRGMKPECFEMFQGGAWEKDGIARLARIAWDYYEKHQSPITGDALKTAIGGMKPTTFRFLSQAFGVVKARVLPTVPEIVSAVTTLRDMRQLVEVKLAADSVLIRANNGEDVTSLIDGVTTRLRKTRAAYSGDRRLDVPLFTSWKGTAIDRSEEYSRGDAYTRVPTGIKRFDDGTGGGLRVGEVFLMHGRTGIGKSHLLQHIAMTVMKQGGTVVLASGEMDVSENFERFDGHAAGRDYLELSRQSGGFASRLRESIQLVSKIKAVPGDLMVIPPVHCRSTGEIREAMIEISRISTPSLLVVDYLTLVKPDGWSGGEDWARHPHTASELKFIGYEFDVPVVTVAQSKRDALKRRPSEENIAFSDGIAHVVNYDFEIRYSDETMEQRLDDPNAELPVEREVILYNVKARRAKTGYKIPLMVNFATGEVRNLSPSEGVFSVKPIDPRNSPLRGGGPPTLNDLIGGDDYE